MGRVLVIGAGGVSTVAVKKIAMNADVFTDIMVASRTKSKCDKIAADIKNVKVQTAQVDADNVQELVALFNAFKPDLVVNLALPYQDLHIMDACLEYDTAGYSATFCACLQPDAIAGCGLNIIPQRFGLAW